MNAYRMSGAGNDFMVIDARGERVDFAPLAKSLCREFGTDGFMAADVSEIADLRLHFYNPDGSRGEMCGNGARCICRFAYELGIAGEEMSLQTDAGIVRGWRLSEETYRVQLNDPSIVDLHRKGDTAYVELGDPGIPHCVTRVTGLEFSQREALLPLAKALRYDPVFPKGVNVNLYDWLDENTVRILTYERGVEDYTLACGTGSASVATVLHFLGQLPGGYLHLENPGGMLQVTVEGEDRIEKIFLEGPTKIEKIVNIDTYRHLSTF